MSVIREFFDYIKSPYFSEGKDPFTVKTLPIIGKLLGYKFLFVIVASILTAYVLNTSGAERPEQNSNFMDDFSLRTLIIVAVFVPVLEELFFRSWLRKRWGVKYIFPIVTLLTAGMLLRFFQISISEFFIGLTAFGVVFYMIWASRISGYDANVDYIDRIFPYVFWITALAFALMHLTNYKVEQIGPLGILMVLPQFMSGALFGYIIKRYGFLASVFAHGTWNGTLVITAAILTGS